MTEPAEKTEEMPEEKSDGRTSLIGELSRWSANLVSVVREEVRPFVVLLIILLVGLVFMLQTIPDESAEKFNILIYCLGGAVLLVVLGGVFMTFCASFRRRGGHSEVATPEKGIDETLTSEERGILTMCIAAEKGSLKGTSSRHISKPIKVRQKALVSMLHKILD
jgi:hypothetical protein